MVLVITEIRIKIIVRVVVVVVVLLVVVVVVRAVWFFDGTVFWHVSFENHTRGVVFEKQKPSELSTIKCLFRLSISDIFRLLAGILD